LNKFSVLKEIKRWISRL